MEANRLLEELRCGGFSIAVEGNGVRLSPASRLTPELRQAIRVHKAELIALLANPTVGNRTETAIAAPCRAESPQLAHQAPADNSSGQPVWVLIRGTYPARVTSLHAVPDGATYWCREGDTEWQPFSSCEQQPQAQSRMCP
jgi:hypothetical protein